MSWNMKCEAAREHTGPCTPVWVWYCFTTLHKIPIFSLTIIFTLKFTEKAYVRSSHAWNETGRRSARGKK